jgi:hypothetical protein
MKTAAVSQWMVVAGTVVGVLLSNVRASAQPTDPAAATKLFNEGRAAVQSGDYEAACKRFAESERLDPRVGTLLNLADCQEHQALLAKAFRSYEDALNLAIPAHDDRASYARVRRDKIAPLVPWITIHLGSGVPEGTRVLLDGVALSAESVGAAIAVDPGRHVITVQVPNKPSKDSEVMIGVREEKVIRVTAGEVGLETPSQPLGSAAVRPTKPPGGHVPPASHKGDRTFAYVAGGVGAAAVLVAATTGLMLIGKNATIRNHCDPDNTCDEQGMSAAESARGLMKLNTASWIVGVVGLGAGTVLWITSGSSTPPGSALVAPSPATGMGVQLRGAF